MDRRRAEAAALSLATVLAQLGFAVEQIACLARLVRSLVPAPPDKEAGIRLE